MCPQVMFLCNAEDSSCARQTYLAWVRLEVQAERLGLAPSQAPLVAYPSKQWKRWIEELGTFAACSVYKQGTAWTRSHPLTDRALAPSLGIPGCRVVGSGGGLLVWKEISSQVSYRHKVAGLWVSCQQSLLSKLLARGIFQLVIK